MDEILHGRDEKTAGQELTLTPEMLGTINDFVDQYGFVTQAGIPDKFSATVFVKTASGDSVRLQKIAERGRAAARSEIGLVIRDMVTKERLSATFFQGDGGEYSLDPDRIFVNKNYPRSEEAVKEAIKEIKDVLSEHESWILDKKRTDEEAIAMQQTIGVIIDPGRIGIAKLF